MDDLPGGWLCELEMEVPFLIHQCQMSPEKHSVDEFDFESLSPETFQSSPNTVSSPTKTCQTIGIKSSTQHEHVVINNTKSISSNTTCAPEIVTPNEILLEQTDCPSNQLQHSSENYLNYIGNGSDDNLSDSLESCKKNNNNQSKCVHVQSLSRPPLQAKNHVVAERIRRERLNQKLISLSALIPGLKKMDKASILGDATKYIKQLEERIKKLEVDEAKKKLVEPSSTTLSLKRPRLSSDDDTSSSKKINFDINSDKTYPDVEIRVSEKHILVRIHCNKQEGVVPKILIELERFQLSVTSSSVLPFGDTALEITIIAQMGDEFNMKVKDLVKNLRLAVLKFT